MPRRHSDEQKQGALELLRNPELSLYDIHNATEIPVSTLHRWADEAGLTGRAGTEKATEAATLRRMERLNLKRAALSEKLLDVVETFVLAAEQAADKGHFSNAGREAKALMMAAGIALDKFRLEMGEATSHESMKIISEDAIDSEIRRLSEQVRRREALAETGGTETSADPGVEGGGGQASDLEPATSPSTSGG